MPATKGVDPLATRDTPIIVGSNTKQPEGIAAHAIFDQPIKPLTSDANRLGTAQTGLRREGSIDSSMMDKVRILGKDEIDVKEIIIPKN